MILPPITTRTPTITYPTVLVFYLVVNGMHDNIIRQPLDTLTRLSYRPESTTPLCSPLHTAGVLTQIHIMRTQVMRIFLATTASHTAGVLRLVGLAEAPESGCDFAAEGCSLAVIDVFAA